MYSYNRYYDSSSSPSFSPNYHPGSRDVYHPEDYDDFGFLKKKSESVVYSTASPVYNHNPTVEIQDSEVLGADERSANNIRSPSPDNLPCNLNRISELRTPQKITRPLTPDYPPTPPLSKPSSCPRGPKNEQHNSYNLSIDESSRM